MDEITEYPFQATVVGKDMVPENPRREKWKFLDSMIETLSRGQTIRLILPKGQKPGGLLSKWKRLVKGKGFVDHIRRIRKASGSEVVYLWYDK